MQTTFRDISSYVLKSTQINPISTNFKIKLLIIKIDIVINTNKKK